MVQACCCGHIPASCERGRDTTLAPPAISPSYGLPVAADEYGMPASSSNRGVVNATRKQRNVNLPPAVVANGNGRSIIQQQDGVPIAGGGSCDSRALRFLSRSVGSAMGGPRSRRRPYGLGCWGEAQVLGC